MAASPCALYKPRVPHATPRYRLVETLYAEVRGEWEECCEGRYGFWRAVGARCAVLPGAASLGRQTALDVRASGRYGDSMSSGKRATVYFDPEIHRALRLKSAATDRPISEIVNDAVRQSLAEDADDLAAFDARAGEPNLDFEAVVKDLRKRGKL